jgi:DNA repair protein RecN (Recombination protein N)
MEQRLASIKVLMKKYGPSISDIHEWDRAAQEQLPQLKISDEDIAQLDSDIISAQKKLIELGDQLSASRQNSAIELAQKIEQELRQLAMPRARISIEVKSQSDPSKWARSGADVVEFTIAADGGDQFRPMGTTVSGGELSRLMLAIEVALSSEHAVPTMIFDEVDAGIGGEVAVQVGRRLAQLGERIQVIVVTHLPQVAAFAQTHFVVDKSSLSGQVTTTVTEVKGEERTREITRMLSGLPDSASGAAHAEELLEMARG